MTQSRVITMGFKQRSDGRLAVAIRSDKNSNEIVKYLTITIEQLSGINQELLGYLEDAVKSANGLIENDAIIPVSLKKTIDQKFSNLANRGYKALHRVFDDETLCIIDNLIAGADQVFFHIDADNFSIPWELLYIDYDYRHFSYSNFWGYKYSIYRTLHPVYPRDRQPELRLPMIEVDGIVNVGLLANTNLKYVEEAELPFLKGLEVDNLIKLFFPKRKLTGKLKNHLLANDLKEFFGLKTHHIIHFACHANPPQYRNEPNDEYCLLLSRDFKLWPSDFHPYPILPFGANPLIILNACSTSPHYPRSSWNMVKTLLDNGAIGAVATEYSIPDIVAAFFIKLFYINLLNEIPVGESIFQARKTLLKAPYHNPFGLLYTLYANPQLRVKRMEKKNDKGR